VCRALDTDCYIHNTIEVWAAIYLDPNMSFQEVSEPPEQWLALICFASHRHLHTLMRPFHLCWIAVLHYASSHQMCYVPGARCRTLHSHLSWRLLRSSVDPLAGDPVRLLDPRLPLLSRFSTQANSTCPYHKCCFVHISFCSPNTARLRPLACTLNTALRQD
jgi:hypothetical protein